MVLLGSKSRTPPASNLANAFGTKLPCIRWRCCAPFTAASGKVRGCPRSGPRASASSPSRTNKSLVTPCIETFASRYIKHYFIRHDASTMFLYITLTATRAITAGGTSLLIKLNLFA